MSEQTADVAALELNVGALRADGPARVTINDPKFGRVDYVEPMLEVSERTDGTLLLSAGWQLGKVRANIVSYLRDNADLVPERMFLADRLNGGTQWRRMTYGEAREKADRVAQALLERGLHEGDVIAILAPPSIEHALLMLGALTIGVAVAPISLSYATIPQAHQRLVDAFLTARQRVLFVQDPDPIRPALEKLDLEHIELVSVMPADGATPFADLLEARPGSEVEVAYRSVDASSIAKILFTSGSTGKPKGVINTHGMLCSNQQMTGELSLRDHSNPPVVLDWLPWHHTFAGNLIFGEVLRTAGNLYLDDGKPVPGPMFARSLDGIREIRPTTYTNVPAGYAMLIEAMERDDGLRRAFFSRLRIMRYGAAAMCPTLYERLQLMAEAERGVRIPMISAFAMTETAPCVTALHWPHDGVGCIGLPLAGVEMKLVPLDEGRYEIRLKGPNVTPGYWRDPQQTRAAFDEEGFFITGDACRFRSEGQPASGLVYDGRVSEEFKLKTGTWVHVSVLRQGLLAAAAPLLKDAVITGEGRAHVGVLAWPSEQFASRCVRQPDNILVPDEEGRKQLADALAAWNKEQQGSSRRIERLLLMAEAPVFGEGEINDKAYVNQRAVLRRREGLVTVLYDSGPDDCVVTPS